MQGNNKQFNSGADLTVRTPVDRHNSAKIHASGSIVSRTGRDFNAVGLAWQYRCGDDY